MNIRVITQPITRTEALEIAQEFYKQMVKGVVDIRQRTIALGGEWHMDANTVLLNKGSRQEDVWGFNFFPEENRIQCTSLINIRPLQNNRVLEVQDATLRATMEHIVHELII